MVWSNGLRTAMLSLYCITAKRAADRILAVLRLPRRDRGSLRRHLLAIPFSSGFQISIGPALFREFSIIFGRVLVSCSLKVSNDDSIGFYITFRSMSQLFWSRFDHTAGHGTRSVINHEKMIRSTQRKMLRLIVQTKRKFKRKETKNKADEETKSDEESTGWQNPERKRKRRQSIPQARRNGRNKRK